MQVLFLTTSFPRAPTDVSGTFVLRLASALESAGLGVEVLAPAAAGSARQDRFGAVKVTRVRYGPAAWQTLAYGYGIPENVRRFPLRLLQSPGLFISMTWKALRRAPEVDVLHAHWTVMGVVARIASFLTRKPYVLTVWGTDLRSLPPWFNRLAMSKAAAIIGVGLEQVRQAESLGFGIEAIPAPRDMAAFGAAPTRDVAAARIGISAERPTIVMVARMAPEKDPMSLIEAMPLVLKQIPTAQCILVGGGPLVDEVSDAVDRLGLERSIILAGAQADVATYLAASDVFVALSPTENVWSTTITEATTVGLPCVLTDAGFTTEVFTHEHDALIVPPRSPSDVANAVIRLLRNPEERSLLVDHCRALHKRHGHDNDLIVSQHIAIYRRALEAPAK